jgi:hypothetical protein
MNVTAAAKALLCWSSLPESLRSVIVTDKQPFLVFFRDERLEREQATKDFSDPSA